jgi:tetratricopeptide (TPR) repeat protein
LAATGRAALVALLFPGMFAALPPAASAQERPPEKPEAKKPSQVPDEALLALKKEVETQLKRAEERLPREALIKKEVIEQLDKSLASYREAAQKPAAGLPAGLAVCQAYRRAGDIENRVAAGAAAESSHRAALAVARELATRFSADPECVQELATCHNALGRTLIATGHEREAMDHFKQSAKLVAEKAAAKDGAAPYRVELARSHHGLALAFGILGERGPARENYRKALEIQKKLAADFPDVPRYRLALAEIHSGIGSWLEGGHWTGNTAEEDDHVAEALKIMTRLADDFPDDPLYRYRLARILSVQANMAGPFGRRIKDFNRSIELLAKLGEEFPQVPAYRDTLHTCYTNLGEIYWMGGDWNSAADLRQKALELSRREAEDRPTKGDGSLAVSLHNWSEVLICRGELAEARKVLQESIEHARAIHKATPHSTYWAADLASSRYLLYAVDTALKNADEAAKVRKEADKVIDETCQRLRDTRGAATAAEFCEDQTVGIGYLLRNLGGGGDSQLVSCLNEITRKAQAKAKEMRSLAR